MSLCRRVPACVTHFPSLRSSSVSNIARIASHPRESSRKSQTRLISRSNLNHGIVPVTGVASGIPPKPHNMRPASSILAQFKSARRKGELATFPAEYWLDVLNEALETRSHQMVDHLVSEIDSHPGDESERRNLLWTIVRDGRLQIIEKESMRSLLEYLGRTPGDIQGSSPEAFDKLLTWACYNTYELGHGDTFHHIMRLLLPFLQELQVSQGFVIPHTPPPVIQSTITFLQWILRQHELQESALAIFGALVDSGYILAETLSEDNGSFTFDSVVFPALTRTCLHWGWAPLASSYLLDFIERENAPTRLCAVLAAETIRLLLEDPTPAELDICGRLIRSTDPTYPIPDPLMSQIYRCAREVAHGQVAETLYAYSRQPEVMRVHRYPPPRGLDLSWLFHYLAKRSKSVHLCKRLAREVVELDLSFPIQYVARFIATIAEFGHSTLARTLWEKFVASEDGSAIVGDPGLLIAMSRLFLSLVNRVESDIAQRDRDHLVQGKIRLQTKLVDLSGFLDRLLQEFRAHHEPLAEAEHHILTTFARACFINGKFVDGFGAFQCLLDRQEVPDRYDVNVALTAIAEHHPRVASQFVDFMVKRNIHPDDSTYCTIMNAALEHKDFDLVDEMANNVLAIQEDREINIKSMMVLINATATPRPGEELPEQRSRLRKTMKLVQSWMESHPMPSMQVGKALVLASLRAGDSEMAFRFWKTLLRDSTEWNDKDQVHLRALLAKKISKDYHSGSVRKELGRSSLTQLRIPPEAYSSLPSSVGDPTDDHRK